MLKSGVRLSGVRPELAFVMPIIRGIFEAKNAPFIILDVPQYPSTLQRCAIELAPSPLGGNRELAELLSAALGAEFSVTNSPDAIRVDYHP